LRLTFKKGNAYYFNHVVQRYMYEKGLFPICRVRPPLGQATYSLDLLLADIVGVYHLAQQVDSVDINGAKRYKLPLELLSLSNLQGLYCAQNRLVDDEEFRKICLIRTLKNLDISYNYLGPILPCIHNLTNLEQLKILGRKLSDTDRDRIFALPRLKELAVDVTPDTKHHLISKIKEKPQLERILLAWEGGTACLVDLKRKKKKKGVVLPHMSLEPMWGSERDL